MTTTMKAITKLFFSKSILTISTLEQIWTIACSNDSRWNKREQKEQVAETTKCEITLSYLT